MLINRTNVKKLALSLASNGRDRVGSAFLDAIEAAVREAVSKRVTHHDNKRGTKRTLV